MEPSAGRGGLSSQRWELQVLEQTGPFSASGFFSPDELEVFHSAGHAAGRPQSSSPDEPTQAGVEAARLCDTGQKGAGPQRRKRAGAAPSVTQSPGVCRCVSSHPDDRGNMLQRAAESGCCLLLLLLKLGKKKKLQTFTSVKRINLAWPRQLEYSGF